MSEDVVWVECEGLLKDTDGAFDVLELLEILQIASALEIVVVGGRL